MSHLPITPPSSSSGAVRLCCRCGCPRPIGQYRRKFKGREERHGECTACRRKADRRRQLVKHRRWSGRTLNELSNAKNLEEAEKLIRALLARFGGLQGFVASWYEWFTDPAMPNSYKAKSLLAISNLTKLTSLERDKLTPSVSQMTDDELAARTAELEERMLRSLVDSGRLEPMLKRLMESD